MDLRHAGSIALLAIMAVAALFFFPAVHGSYSSTHGPMTALRSQRLRAFLLCVISAAAAALTAMVNILVALGRCGSGSAPILAFSPHLVSSPLRL